MCCRGSGVRFVVAALHQCRRLVSRLKSQVMISRHWTLSALLSEGHFITWDHERALAAFLTEKQSVHWSLSEEEEMAINYLKCWMNLNPHRMDYDETSDLRVVMRGWNEQRFFTSLSLNTFFFVCSCDGKTIWFRWRWMSWRPFFITLSLLFLFSWSGSNRNLSFFRISPSPNVCHSGSNPKAMISVSLCWILLNLLTACTSTHMFSKWGESGCKCVHLTRV